MPPQLRALLPLLVLTSALAWGVSGQPQQGQTPYGQSPSGQSQAAQMQPGQSSAARLTPFPYLRPGRPLPPPRPGEQVLLTLEGQGRSLALTRAQLLALPAVRYATEHAQLHRTFVYEGVPLRDLAELGGFAGRDMRLYASNGFVTTIRARDYMTAPILLAYAANGRPIPVLEKGPLTVVLPPNPQRFPPHLYGAAWVWFVERITPAP